MIITEFYNGQGLGNQLHCYVTTRVVALDKNYNFGIARPHLFKGSNFMDLDFGLPVYGGRGPDGGPPIKLPQGIKHYFTERNVQHPVNGCFIGNGDPELENIKDNTKLDGYFQSEDRIIHRKDEIKQWLKLKPETDFTYSSEDICIINFRGRSRVYDYNFFLPHQYWMNAVERMKRINPRFTFIVITDDIKTAKRFFPFFKVYHFDIATDYSIIKNSKFLILSNSSFPYFATLCSDTIKFIIAPKYWGSYNTSDGYWSLGCNIFRNYHYIDRENNIFTYEQCKKEYQQYMERNKYLWQ